jgi:hypothetical protein
VPRRHLGAPLWLRKRPCHPVAGILRYDSHLGVADGRGCFFQNAALTQESSC